MMSFDIGRNDSRSETESRQLKTKLVDRRDILENLAFLTEQVDHGLCTIVIKNGCLVLTSSTTFYYKFCLVTQLQALNVVLVEQEFVDDLNLKHFGHVQEVFTYRLKCV